MVKTIFASSPCNTPAENRATCHTATDSGRPILRPNDAFTYAPKENPNGAVRFVYRAGDGRGGADNAVVILRIEACPR